MYICRTGNQENELATGVGLLLTAGGRGASLRLSRYALVCLAGTFPASTQVVARKTVAKKAKRVIKKRVCCIV